MRTTKPISTISFNSKDYLKQKLDELVKAKRISFYSFIVHKPEDDEGGKKEHIHLYIEPSKMLQTDDLKEEFKEFDLEKPDKPKGCINFHTSKFADWYLYSLHDRAYLAMKGQARRHHYTHDDIMSSDDDNLLFLSKSINMLEISPYKDMESAMNNGITWAEYVARGGIPIPQINADRMAWETLWESGTARKFWKEAKEKQKEIEKENYRHDGED